MARIPTKETIKRTTIRDMKRLGTHKPEYNRLIDIYAGLVHDYLVTLDEWERGGRQYATETAAGGTKKSAIVSTLENLRKDILQYSDRLCLNPKSAGEKKEKGKGSALAEALRELEK